MSMTGRRSRGCPTDTNQLVLLDDDSLEVRRRLQQRLAKKAFYQRAYGDWLVTFPWQFWCTYTFEKPVSKLTAASMFKRYVRRVEQRVQQGLSWFVVYETGSAGDFHIHGLISTGVTARGTIGHLRSAWTWGFSEVKRYQPTGGASRYLLKKVGYGDVEEDMHIRLPGPTSPRTTDQSVTW